jgi:hypothetical protein
MARIKIRTPAELRRLARQEVESELRDELFPLQQQKRQVSRRRAAVLSDLNRLYGGALQPEATASAGRVRAAATDTQNIQKSIFDQAAARLDSLKGAAAQEAQALAQTVGGPVPVGEFTAPVSLMQGASAELGAGALLQSSALGAAGAQAAESFAGQTLPLMRKEAETEEIMGSEEDLADLMEEMRKIQGSRGGRQSKRFQELLAAEREAQLSQSQLDLQALQGKREFGLAKRSASLAEQDLGLRTRAQKETERAQRTTETLTRQQFQQEGALAYQDYRTQKEGDAWDILNTSAQGGGTVTVTEPVAISKERADRLRKNNPNADFFFANGGWYLNQKRTYQVGGGFTDDEAGYNASYNLLVGSSIPPDIALRMVRGYWNQPNWNPGKAKQGSGLPPRVKSKKNKKTAPPKTKAAKKRPG